MGRDAFFAVCLLAVILLAGPVFATTYASVSSCGDDGRASFQIKYSGGRIDLYDFLAEGLKKSSNTAFNFSGTWYLGNLSVSEISSDEVVYPKLVSSDEFRSKGTYVVTLRNKKESAVFLMNCPGTPCKDSSQCDEDAFCNENGICENLECSVCEAPANHACGEKCDDGNYCTKDLCKEGVCSNKQIDNCCFTASNCNDNLLCTTDSCEGYRCVHKEVTCDKKACETGSCREFLGCVYESNTTCVREKRKLYYFLTESFFGKVIKSLKFW